MSVSSFASFPVPQVPYGHATNQKDVTYSGMYHTAEESWGQGPVTFWSMNNQASGPPLGSEPLNVSHTVVTLPYRNSSVTEDR